jgi:GlcNAc-P-P-Und epimerase
MKILLTGANGFLGKIISNDLKNHEVISLDLKKANIECNIAIKQPLLPAGIDLVIHCAGKAHVIPKNKLEEEEFFKINFKGTVNLCNSLLKSKGQIKNFILISTVSVYGKETGQDITEDTPLNGKTPYALSKIKAENYLQSWAEENGINTIILRLPLILGPNPPGNLGKMIEAIAKRRFFLIGKGEARKSIICADDLTPLILKNIDKTGIYNLTDGIHPSFANIVSTISEGGNYKRVVSLPLWFANIIAHISKILPSLPFNRGTLNKMTLDLTFQDKKARSELGWSPTPALTKLKEIITRKNI